MLLLHALCMRALQLCLSAQVNSGVKVECTRGFASEFQANKRELMRRVSCKCHGAQVITAFPELAACSVDKMLKANVAKLERDWKIKGAKAVTVIKQRPQVCHTSQEGVLNVTFFWLGCT